MESNNVSIIALQGLCKEVAEKRAELDEIKKHKTEKESQYNLLCEKLIEVMQDHDLKSFDNGEAKFSIRNQPYAKIIDRDALAAHLKKQGTFNDFYTFNSQKMNSYYKECLEQAIESGADDFEIDGMEMTSNRQTIQIRKGR